MAEPKKRETKAKRSSTNKSKVREAANQLQNAATTEAAVGVLNTAEGAADLQAASDLSKASRDSLAKGSSDATRGADALRAARRQARRGRKAAAEGERDVAQGSELLSASEELAIESAIVSEMSADDLDHGMKLASIAGQLWATSNVLSKFGMPLIADFLEDKGWQQQWQRQVPKSANLASVRSRRVSNSLPNQKHWRTRAACWLMQVSS